MNILSLILQTAPEQYFDLTMLRTFTGASAAIYLLANLWQKFTNKNPAIFGLIMALLLVLLYYATPECSLDWWHVILVPLNALFLYSSALGITEMAQNSVKHETNSPTKRSFNTSWLK